MSLFDLMLKSAVEPARPKRRPRRSLAIPKEKRLATPFVVDRGRRVDDSGRKINPKTKRSKRVEKVRAFEAKLGIEC